MVRVGPIPVLDTESSYKVRIGLLLWEIFKPCKSSTYQLHFSSLPKLLHGKKGSFIGLHEINWDRNMDVPFKMALGYLCLNMRIIAQLKCEEQQKSWGKKTSKANIERVFLRKRSVFLLHESVSSY